MQCLILAGGLGTRIKTVAGNKPKALLQIGPQSFLDWQLQWLKLLGVTDVVLALGYGSDEIVMHVEAAQVDPRYPQVKYSFDVSPEDRSQAKLETDSESVKEILKSKLLGTGGAVKKAAPLLAKNFIVAYGDSFLFLNLHELMNVHEKTGHPLTFSIFKNANQGDASNVIYKSGKLEKYDKFNIVPEMQYIDYGMSVVNKDYFLKQTPDGQFDFAKFLTETIAQKKATPFIAEHIFQETGSPAGYQKFCDLMKDVNYDLEVLAARSGLNVAEKKGGRNP